MPAEAGWKRDAVSLEVRDGASRMDDSGQSVHESVHLSGPQMHFGVPTGAIRRLYMRANPNFMTGPFTTKAAKVWSRKIHFPAIVDGRVRRFLTEALRHGVGRASSL